MHSGTPRVAATAQNHSKSGLASKDDWRRNVPSVLIEPVKRLEKLFNKAHSRCKDVTQSGCYSLLHCLDEYDSHQREHEDAQLKKLFLRLDPSQIESFELLLKRNTPPATLKAFFTLYVDVLRKQTTAVSAGLVKIALNHTDLLQDRPLEWAEWQAKKIVANTRRWVILWLHQSCDGGLPLLRNYSEETHWFGKWRAPKLLTMSPVMGAPYVFNECWERLDEAGTRNLVEYFIELYAGSLESEIDNVVGDTHLSLAMSEKERSSPPKSGAQSPTRAKPKPDAPVQKRRPAKSQDLSMYLDAAKLTERQYNCASLKFEYGLNVSEIARQLNICRKTVDQHIHAANLKMSNRIHSEKVRMRRSRANPEE